MIDKTIDNGESEVQVATIGTVIGSTPEGEPIEQNFSEEALKKIAENQTDEILVDADHQSEKNSDTSAKGWLSDLKFVEGKGLFGKIKWTNLGKSLIENRVFRWLSPSWLLNADTKEPIEMTSCALTNKPSQLGRIEPIVNSSPIEQNFANIKEIENMNIDELKKIIRDVIAEVEAEKVETEKEETETVETENADTTEDTTAEKAVEEKSEVESEETVNEEVAEEKKEEEVIKLESLNSSPSSKPTVCSSEEWRSLHGQDFFDWCRKHKI